MPDDKQLEFDFMRTTPKQLNPSAERKSYAAYLRAVRDSPTQTTIGGSDATKTQGRKVLLTRRKV
jgi:hypothetical protein